jgi:hypothetical protein
MNLDALPWKDMTTVGLAALGAGLGVMNTWNALNQRRERLDVRPTYAVDPNGQRPTMLSIAVTNLSSFPMTINEVGNTGKARAKGGKRAVSPSHTLSTAGRGLAVWNHAKRFRSTSVSRGYRETRACSHGRTRELNVVSTLTGRVRRLIS